MKGYRIFCFNNFICDLPCEDVRGSVDDFIAGLGGFESAKITKSCLLVKLQQKKKTETILLFDYSRRGTGLYIRKVRAT